MKLQGRLIKTFSDEPQRSQLALNLFFDIATQSCSLDSSTHEIRIRCRPVAFTPELNHLRLFLSSHSIKIANNKFLTQYFIPYN